MDFSNEYKLEKKIEELKKEAGLDDKEVKKIFIKKYLLDDEGKSVDEMFGEMLHGKKEEPEEE